MVAAYRIAAVVRSGMRFVVVLAVLFVAAPGCKADKDRCDQAARNFATLTFWERAEVEIAAAPAARRETLRKKKLSQFTSELETRIDLVVSQCQSANNDEQIDCMIAAKTGTEALKCADLVPKE
jgi:hypothetical protein